ncbi:GNAT family N-acetyltransferase [Jhaorihella thermophila]
MTPSIPTLETPRLILRAPRAEDFPPFAEFYASDRASFVGGPLTPEGSWRMLAMEIGHWALKGFGRWIAETRDTGEPVGLIGLFAPEGWPEPEIGWDLFNGHEGRGYATEAALHARAYAYDVLGWQTAISLVKPGNEKNPPPSPPGWARGPTATLPTNATGSCMSGATRPPSELADGGMEAYA